MSIKGRVERLERQAGAGDARPPYLVVQDESELDALLERVPPGFYKVYIGVSPDDWDTEDEQTGGGPNEPKTAVG